MPIRPLALCVFAHEGRILVCEGDDPVSGVRYCRPLGGGIEFGEPSQDAIAREIHEELGAKIVNQRLLGTLESIFTYLGEPRHEIIQVYDAEFVDRNLYGLPFLSGNESDDTSFEAHWRAKSYFDSMPLLPLGLMAILEQHTLIG